MNNRILCQGITLLGLAIAAATASAAEDSGFYVGVGVGEAQIDAGDFDDGDTAFKVFGGYSIDKSFAVELSYTDGGTTKESGINGALEVETTIVNVSLVGTLPLTNAFSLFGKLGYASIEQESEFTDFLGVDSDSDKETDEELSYGAGVAFNLGSRWKIRAEYEGYNVSDGDLNVFSINGLFRF